MNINPSAAASIAGTSRAAARGGESDGQAIESTRQQATAEKPGGKSAQSSEIDAGDQAGDRGGNGRQVLDHFEKSEDQENQESPKSSITESEPPTTGPGLHIDLEA